MDNSTKNLITSNTYLMYSLKNSLRTLIANTLRAIGSYEFTEQDDDVEMTTDGGEEYKVVGFIMADENPYNLIVKAVSIDDPNGRVQSIRAHYFDFIYVGEDILSAIQDKWEQENGESE